MEVLPANELWRYLRTESHTLKNSTGSAFVTSATVILLAARGLTCTILCLWGFFIIAHLVGGEGAASRVLTPRDYEILFTMIVSLCGLAAALKWERSGATLALIAVTIGAVLNWKVLLFPATLIPITATLFLMHSYLRIPRIA
jgi:hypothetical protein